MGTKKSASHQGCGLVAQVATHSPASLPCACAGGEPATNAQGCDGEAGDQSAKATARHERPPGRAQGTLLVLPHGSSPEQAMFEWLASSTRPFGSRSRGGMVRLPSAGVNQPSVLFN